jgi:hypothetical protein
MQILWFSFLSEYSVTISPAGSSSAYLGQPAEGTAGMMRSAFW